MSATNFYSGKISRAETGRLPTSRWAILGEKWAKLLEAEDQAAAEVDHFGGGNRDVSAGAYGSAGGGAESAVSDLRDAPFHVVGKAVIYASEELVIDLADVDGAERGLGDAFADGGLKIGPEG